MFIGTIDNGEEYFRFGIKKDSAYEAWYKLLEVAEKVADKYDDYRDNINCIKLWDENMMGICDWDEDVERILREYDEKHCNMTMLQNQDSDFIDDEEEKEQDQGYCI